MPGDMQGFPASPGVTLGADQLGLLTPDRSRDWRPDMRGLAAVSAQPRPEVSSNATLMLHAEGETLVDSSVNRLPIASSGGVTVSRGKIRMPAGSWISAVHTDFLVNTGAAFTLEFLVKFTGRTLASFGSLFQVTLGSETTNRWVLLCGDSQYSRFNACLVHNYYGEASYYGASGRFLPGVQYRVRVQRNTSNVLYFWINDDLVHVQTRLGALGNTGYVLLFSASAALELDELRFCKTTVYGTSVVNTTPTDPFAGQTTLLLQGDNENGSTAITDDSSLARLPYSSSATNSTSRSVYGVGSYATPSFSYKASDLLIAAGAEFTLEFDVYYSSVATNCIYAQFSDPSIGDAAGRIVFGINASGVFYHNQYGSADQTYGTAVWGPGGVWCNFILQGRNLLASSRLLQVWKDRVYVGERSLNAALGNGGGGLQFGGVASTQYDNIRFSNYARYGDGSTQGAWSVPYSSKLSPSYPDFTLAPL